MESSQVLQFFLAGLTLGSIYALVGFSVALVHRASNIMNLAQGEFSMLGAMTAIYLTSVLKMPIVPALAVAVVLGSMAGLLLERLAIRPALHFPTIMVVMVTVGAAIALEGFAVVVWGRDSFTLTPFSGQDPIPVFGATILPQALWILGVGIVLSAFFWVFFEKTTIGLAMRASAENRTAAALLGIEEERMKMLAFGLSAGVAALAGILIAPIVFTSFLTGLMITIKGSVAAVLGGINSNVGVILGGLILGMLESLSAGFLPSLYKDVIAVLLLLILLCLKPKGIIGERR